MYWAGFKNEITSGVQHEYWLYEANTFTGFYPCGFFCRNRGYLLKPEHSLKNLDNYNVAIHVEITEKLFAGNSRKSGGKY